MSDASTASNYAKDWADVVPVRSELTNGPFLHKPLQTFQKILVFKLKDSLLLYCEDCVSASVQTVDALKPVVHARPRTRW
jgi:hypothetical protein